MENLFMVCGKGGLESNQDIGFIDGSAIEAVDGSGGAPGP
jgi:hypothetical protein